MLEENPLARALLYAGAGGLVGLAVFVIIYYLV